MRKISKISLVAAVAVAGFSTANAQPLEEAIKNVDVSGSVVYRYDNAGNNRLDAAGNKTGNTTDRNRYKVGLNLSSKVNDYVKFNSRFIIGGADSGWATTGAKKNGNLNNVNGDGNVDVTLSNAYFGFTAIPNTIVNVGKQGLTTPYTVAVDINGNEQNGTGILALSTFGPITAGAGYFNNTNVNQLTDINASRGLTGAGLTLDAGRDMYVATVQGDLDFVKLEAWYAGLQNTFNSYTFAATGKIDIAENAKLGLEARYVALNLTDDVVGLNGVARNNHLNGVALASTNQGSDNGMLRLAVDGKFSIVNARLAYTKTDKEGGLTALDQDAKNTSLGWNITSNGYADADYFQGALGVDILDNLNFTAHYGNLSSDTQSAGAKFVGLSDTKAEEIYGQLTYKMSKNLSTYLRYGNYEEKVKSTGVKSVDQDIGRLQVAYTF
ncbi:major outer membrane protein [Aliarcobacter cryaerophilus]|uniref:major outer membrane protein n=1 Tax=Aliarcobacter cryaerophilus TaxID=28198 RepID=UPI000EB36107|nr:major outer membrane protein [Aliarcobacter cryaerophilus]AYJ77547.1 Campylo_MOMP domain-containing protein [Aliarcobacter cryaerophilus D2610]